MKTCNMCHKDMRFVSTASQWLNDESALTVVRNVIRVKLGLCLNPKCPNFALLQMPVEYIPKELKSSKKRVNKTNRR